MSRCPALLFFLCLLPTASAADVEWSRFRGPNGSGIAPAIPLPHRWGEKDHTWKVELPGVGHSSPVLWGDRLFVTAAESDGKRLLLCLRATDGERLWAREFPAGKHGKHQDNSFASSTPTVDEKHVYVCWGSPRDFLVVAIDHGGKEVWRVDLGGFKSGHGFGPSPIVHDDLVVVPNDQDGQRGFLIGLERDTGKPRWKVPRNSRATYTTPCIYQPEDGRAELIFSNYEHGLTSIDPKTGAKNWEIDIFDKGHVETGIGSPIVAGGLVLATCGWMGVRQEVVAVRPPMGAGGKATVAYTLDRSAPLCTTPLAKDNLVFLWSDSGIVSCADRASGKVHWRERVPGSYYASPVCVGNSLINVTRDGDGDVVVVAAADKFELVGRGKLGEGSHATPAVAGGRIYFRTFSHLIAVGGKP